MFIKLTIGLITSKVLALFVGPSGMALLGNLRNFMTFTESVSTLGFQNGIVKYVTDNEKNKTQLNKILSTLFFSLLLVTGFLGSLLFLFSNYLNHFIFGSQDEYVFVFKILAVLLPWYVASIYLTSVINGLGKINRVIYINITGYIIGLLVTCFLVYFYTVKGALLSIIITPSLLFLVTLYYIFQELPIHKCIKWSFFDINIIKNLFHYFLMALVSGVLGPLVFLLIRNQIINTIGITQAGYWEAISRISSYYLLFISTLITVYYYPKLVIAKINKETKKVFLDFYKNILPFFGVALVIIFIFKSFIVKILFTSDFAPITQLFFWQLVGDFFKVVSLILGMQFFAKKMTAVFIITEILSLTVLISSSYYFISIFSINGVVMAHAFTYAMYLLVLGVYFRKIFFNN